ncbi:MAG: hypothetical protein PHV23_05165 [Candidatus Gracilibacteria bacterium]|nr:hypothetical protein [Candidatus Gracilibacteria bacterium]
MPAILLTIGTAIISVLGFLTKTGTKVISGLVPILYEFVKKSFRILFLVAFWGLFLNFTTTLIAFILYHINLTVGVALSNYTTGFTVNILSYYILGIVILIVGKIFYKLIS